MTYQRMSIVLNEHEMKQLRERAQRDLRRPGDQAVFILRSVLLGDQPCQLNDTARGHQINESQPV